MTNFHLPIHLCPSGKVEESRVKFLRNGNAIIILIVFQGREEPKRWRILLGGCLTVKN